MPKNIKINLADCLGTSNKCGKVDEQRIWEFQRRLETLEAKPDNDNQLLSLTDNKLSITNGNEVTLPVYDDTKLTEKVNELENRPQGSNQTLSLEGVNLSISDGNTIKLPTIGLENTEVILEKSSHPNFKGDTYEGNVYFINFTSPTGEKFKLPLPTLVDLMSQDFDYGEFFVTDRGKVLFYNGYPTHGLNTSFDSLIKLTKLDREDNKLILELKNPRFSTKDKYVLSEVELPEYDDKEIKERLTNLENKSDKDTIYDDSQVRELIKGNTDKLDKFSQDLTSVGNRVSNTEGSIINLNETTSNNSKEIEALKNKTDVFVSDMSFSREGDEVTLKYTRTDGVEKSVSFTDKNTTMVAYDDEPLKARVKALEDKPDSDKQTLTLNGDTLSISNGNSVKVPQMVQWYPHIAWAEEVNPVKNFTTITSVSAPQSAGFYANYVGFCYTTSKEDPQTPTSYRWTRVSQVTELERQLEELKKNGSTNVPQTLSIEGTTLSISDGNSVELPISTNKELEKIVENLKPLSNNVSGEMTTYSGHSVYINKIGDFVNLTFDSYAVRNVWQLPEGFRPKFTQTAPLWHKDTGEYVGKVVLEPNGEFNETIVDKFKSIAYSSNNDPHDGTSIYENIHTLTMSYYVGG